MTVDEVLGWFLMRARALLGTRFVGMYMYGSRALGDFDPLNSDIDFIIVTEGELAHDVIVALREMHEEFDQSGSPWVENIEVVYADREALRTFPASAKTYPQVEKGRKFFVEPLEIGWIFQCFILRHYGVVVDGPAPKELIPPLDPDEMRRAAAPVASMWQRQAREDPTWLEWLRGERHHHAFVVLTLCRLLYTLERTDVASKPRAAQWAQELFGERWFTLIADALPGQRMSGPIEPWEEEQTLALLDYTVRRFHERLRS